MSSGTTKVTTNTPVTLPPTLNTTLTTILNLTTQESKVSAGCSELDSVWWKASIIISLFILLGVFLISTIIFVTLYRYFSRSWSDNKELAQARARIRQPNTINDPNALMIDQSARVQDFSFNQQPRIVSPNEVPSSFSTNMAPNPSTNALVEDRTAAQKRTLFNKNQEDEMVRNKHLDMMIMAGRNDPPIGRNLAKVDQSGNKSRSKKRRSSRLTANVLQPTNGKEKSLKNTNRAKNPTFVVDKNTNQVKRVDPDQIGSESDDVPSVLDANSKAINIPFKF